MAQVELRNLNKVYTDPQTKKEVHAVKQLELSIRDGEFLVLVGPSGCGKTTALRMLAGLEEISSGDIFIGERVVNDLPSGERDIAMVFQNYALYPHMSVYDNLAFGLRQRLLPSLPKQLAQPSKVRDIKADIDKRIQEAAVLLDIKHLLARKPKALSGGQRQRVALGRAIVRHPQVFLMDEPLSNLDAKLRVQMRAELIRLHRQLGVTTVYVTHDQAEAMTMGQRIAVMRDGVLQQCDAPLELYRRPCNLFVAGFLGTPSMNFIPARVVDLGSGAQGPTLDADSFQLRLPAARRDALQSYVGKSVTLGIRPEDIYAAAHVSPSVEHGEPARAQVDVIEAMGADSVLYLTVGRHTLVASVNAEVVAQEGAPINIVINSGAVHVFDVETELTIV